MLPGNFDETFESPGKPRKTCLQFASRLQELTDEELASRQEAGFVEAGNRWSEIFDDDITINIEIDFGPIPSDAGATILGATGTSLVDSPADLGGMFPTFDSLKDSLADDATSENDMIAVDNLPDGNTATNGPPLSVLSFLTNDRAGNTVLDDDTSVSYTHLTLPTKRIV